MLSYRTQTIALGLALALTVAIALLVAGPVAAQNPGADQYTPTAPSGSGPTPATTPDDGPASLNSAPSSPADPDPATSDDGDSAVASPATATAGTAATASAAKKRSSKPKRNGDQRTLGGIAASAAQELSAEQDKAAASRLLRDEGSDAGLGILFWVILAGTVLWALLTAFARRRDAGDPNPTSATRATSGPRTQSDSSR